MKQTNQPVFVCLTSYQYMAADLMAKKYYRENGVTSLIILKYINGINPMNNEYARYILIPRTKSGKIKTLWYSTRLGPDWKSKDLYFFNDRDPISKNIAKWCDKKIVVEEGFGTYFGAPGVKPIGEEIVPDLAYAGYPDLYKLKHSHDCEIRKIDYKSLFNRADVKEYFNTVDSNILEADIIFLGQASKESDVLRDHETAVLKMIQKIVPYSRILLKPHPRDLFPDKYVLSENIQIADKKASAAPIEALIFGMNTKCVITMFSSAAITLSNMFQDLNIILTYSVRNLELGEMMLNMKHFTKFAHNLHIPNNEGELEELKTIM